MTSMDVDIVSVSTESKSKLVHAELQERYGAGFVYLHDQLTKGQESSKDETSDDNVLSSPAKKLLKRLLNEHGIELNLGTRGLPLLTHPIQVSRSATKPSFLEGEEEEEHRQKRLKLSSPRTEYQPEHHRPVKKRPIDSNMSDERIMQLAQRGELSFLASILKIMEEEIYENTHVMGGSNHKKSASSANSVTTKFLIKSCCLAISPARVPAACDAKEMVMAALYFLSCPEFLPDYENKGRDRSTKDLYPRLPLIQQAQQQPMADLEKRSYQPAYDWTFRSNDSSSDSSAMKGGGDGDTSDYDLFLQQVLNLEEIFFDSVDTSILTSEQSGAVSPATLKACELTNNMYLAREHTCPPLPNGGTLGRDLLLLKGSAPSFAIGKSKSKTLTSSSEGATGTGQRRKSTKSTMPGPSSTKKTPKTSPNESLTKATIDEADGKHLSLKMQSQTPAEPTNSSQIPGPQKSMPSSSQPPFSPIK